MTVTLSQSFSLMIAFDSYLRYRLVRVLHLKLQALNLTRLGSNVMCKVKFAAVLLQQRSMKSIPTKIPHSL